MSFDIFFRTCRFTGKSAVRTNPFTGQSHTVLLEEPLGAAERKAVRQVLKRFHAQGPDEYGCYVVEVDDGGSAEVFAEPLKTDCMVALRGLTPGLIQFLYDLLQAGNWVMIPVMEDALAITASSGSVKGVPEDFPRVIVCDSTDELGVLLADGVQAWERYRDQGRNRGSRAASEKTAQVSPHENAAREPGEDIHSQ